MPISNDVRSLRYELSPSTPPSFSSIVHNALYCTTNEVLLKSRWTVIAESYEPWLHSGPYEFRSPFDATLCHQTPTARIGGYVTTYRSIRKGYYHVLLDNLPRIAHLHDPRYRSLKIDVLASDRLPEYEEDLVRKLLPDNCTIRFVDPRSVYEVDRFILPAHLTYWSAAILHPEYLRWFRERVLPPRPSRRNRLVFISRRRANRGRRITNRDEVDSILRRFGFEIHELETYSVEEQVELFHDARVVVGAHGAGLSNVIFSDHGIDVVELFPIATVYPHYYYLCKSLGHRYRYLLGNEGYINDNFNVDVDALESNLKTILNA